MIRRRSSILALLVVVATAALAACTPSTGALGAPATPASTASASDEPGASDVTPATAPSSAEPTGIASPSPSSSTPSEQPTRSQPTPTPTASPSTTVVRAYFMLGSFTDNAGLVPVLRDVPATRAVATAAMKALLDGPNASEMAARPAMYTSIPDGTRLLDLAIKDGVATVNLSAEFKDANREFQGGVANAEVVYTLTQFTTVNRVRIQVDGQSQGGALGREDFQVQGILPAIFVDRPAWGASIGNPAPVSGLANVFEATFRVQLRDAKGDTIADERVMASCGTGCWGTFRTTLSYAVNKAQYGTLRVFDLSAKDGSPENVTEYRVWLTPAG